MGSSSDSDSESSVRKIPTKYYNFDLNDWLMAVIIKYLNRELNFKEWVLKDAVFRRK